MAYKTFTNPTRFNAANYGLADFVVGSAATGCITPEQSNVTDGKSYRYYAQSADGAQWEMGRGPYTIATHTLGRVTIEASSSADGVSKVDFALAPIVDVFASASEFLDTPEVLYTPMSLTSPQKDRGRANLDIPGANVLINGDFRINQRVYVSAATLAAGAYGHDRWKAGSGGGDYSFTQLASSTQITIAADKTLIQVVEDNNVAGGNYVLSWTGTSLARVGINTDTPSGSYAASPILIAGQTAGTTMSVEFGNGSSAGTLATVKLETGTVATPFVMTDFEVELARCLRYFWTNGHARSMFGYNSASGTLFYPVAFHMPMRAAPTITTSFTTSACAASISASSAQGFEIVLSATVGGIFTAVYAAGNTASAEL